MIRFSAFLVVVAVGLLVAGVVTSKLLLVYVAIGVSGVALLALGIGAAVKWRELFGKPTTAASDVGAPEPVAAQAAAFQAPQAQPGLTAYSRPSAAGPVWEPADPLWEPAARPGAARPAAAQPAATNAAGRNRPADPVTGSVPSGRAAEAALWESAVPPTGTFPRAQPAAPQPQPDVPRVQPDVPRSQPDVPRSRHVRDPDVPRSRPDAPQSPVGRAGTRYPLGRTARRRIPAFFGAGGSPGVASGRLPASVARVHAAFRRRLPVAGPQRVEAARGLSSGPAPGSAQPARPASPSRPAAALDLRPGSPPPVNPRCPCPPPPRPPRRPPRPPPGSADPASPSSAPPSASPKAPEPAQAPAPPSATSKAGARPDQAPEDQPALRLARQVPRIPGPAQVPSLLPPRRTRPP